MKLHNEVSPTMSERQSRKMEFSPGPKQISNTQINQLIKAEVEKRIRERAMTEAYEEKLKNILFPEDDGQDDYENECEPQDEGNQCYEYQDESQDEQKKWFNVFYGERQEKPTQADEKMKTKPKNKKIKR